VTKARPADVPASIRQRLLNLARSRNAVFQDVLVRFGTERLLYRLSTSPHAGRFVLKGATLFAAWTGAPHRVTRDVDLLGIGDNTPGALASVFRELAASKSEGADGLVFDADSVRAVEIREDNVYGGVRVTFNASLAGARIPLQVDVGIGDAVEPPPEEVELPVLLPLPAPRLRAYPREVVVAEKLETIVKLGLANSRMKDYYDLWYLVTKLRPEPARLRRAITATFNRRGTAIPAAAPVALTDAFALDPSRIRMWQAFLDRTGVPTEDRPSLAAAVSAIRSLLSRRW
jgi:predicted nucleotidyltransferase component of viral defense system